MPTRNVVLTDHQAQLLERLVASGRYQNASEVLRAGLRLVEQQEDREAARLVRDSGITQRVVAPQGHFQQSLPAGRSYHLLRLRRVDGTAMWVEVTARALPVGDSHTLRMEATMRDVTDRKRMEEDHAQDLRGPEIEIGNRRQLELATGLAPHRQRLPAHRRR